MSRRLVLAVAFAAVVSVGIMEVSDLWTGFCAGVCPWSPLCVQPLCDPSGGGSGQGS
jgi:hypothetical protein